jgi:hypothetical protein
MNRSAKSVVIALAASAVLIGLALRPSEAADAAAKPKYTIKEIMKKAHKGDDCTVKHVLKGQGTKEELKELLEYYQVLPQLEPPTGSPASWKEKTAKLLQSTESLNKGEAGSMEAFKAAVNCKACHDVHKPKQKN